MEIPINLSGHALIAHDEKNPDVNDIKLCIALY
jgi:hypothetical protein